MNCPFCQHPFSDCANFGRTARTIFCADEDHGISIQILTSVKECFSTFHIYFPPYKHSHIDLDCVRKTFVLTYLDFDIDLTTSVDAANWYDTLRKTVEEGNVAMNKLDKLKSFI